jgi:hypothetical protein
MGFIERAVGYSHQTVKEETELGDNYKFHE